MCILAEQMKARIVRRSVHNERETNRLTTFTAVVGTYPDIVIRIVSTTLVNLLHDAYRIFHVKHRQSPHLPVGIARMGIVGKLYIYRPIIVKTILYLLADLVVGQWRQEGKGSLRKVKSHSNKSSFLNSGSEEHQACRSRRS